MGFLADFFGYIIRFIYELTNNNYAISILLFTLFTKLILMPLSYKQNKSSIEMQKIKPMQDEIVKKYKDDKLKQSEEISKLYKEHKINPLGGCLLLIIQLPIIISIFYIVKQPLTYVMQMSNEEIMVYAEEIKIYENDIYTADLYNEDGSINIKDNQLRNMEIEIANKKDIIDMNMLGLNLGDVPANAFSDDENKKSSIWSLLIPILSVILSTISIKRMQKNSSMTEEQKEMQKSMNFTMPLISGIISYTMPLALGVYWSFGSLIQIIQTEVVHKMLKKDKETKLFLNEEEKK